jgi:hypothetical protein
MMPPMIGPKPNENMRKELPIRPEGILVPRIVIRINPVKKKRMTEVNIALPKIMKNSVSRLALIAFDCIN